MKKNIILVLLLIIPNLTWSAEEKCKAENLSTNMCAGFGYCTGYPLGNDGDPCPAEFVLKSEWTATFPDCLKGKTETGKFSCANKGKIRTTLLGKSNAYKCICE